MRALFVIVVIIIYLIDRYAYKCIYVHKRVVLHILHIIDMLMPYIHYLYHTDTCVDHMLYRHAYSRRL